METNTSAYPLRLTGELSQRLSRGLWLVKWVLSSPRSSRRRAARHNVLDALHYE
jgi:hypothetical protein